MPENFESALLAEATNRAEPNDQIMEAIRRDRKQRKSRFIWRIGTTVLMVIVLFLAMYFL